MSEILNNEAVAELEKRIDSFPLSPHQARALCATVKDLRRERDEAIKARDLYVSLKRGQQERADEIEARALELLQERNDLQSQLEQLRAELAEEKRLRSELKQIAQTGISEVSSVGTALKDIALIGFRSRAIQLCKDKAAEHRKIADIRTENLNDTGAMLEQVRADTANEICSELEKL